MDWLGPLRTPHVGLCCPLVFKQTGTCQRSAEPAFRSVESRKNRSCARVTCVVPPEHADDTYTTGDPGWSTKVGMMRSTGLPEVSATEVQKSCDVAFP